MLCPMQMATYTCRPAQSWSGGLTIKCNKAIAVKIDDDNTFTVHRTEGPKINGVACAGSKPAPPGHSHDGLATIQSSALRVGTVTRNHIVSRH